MSKDNSSFHASTIEERKWEVLKTLADEPRDKSGDAWISGSKIGESTGLSPAEINDTINLLRDHGFVEWRLAWDTAPFKFRVVTITPRGRSEIERVESAEIQAKRKAIPTVTPSRPSKNVFIVHGRDDKAKLELARILESWDLMP